MNKFDKLFGPNPARATSSGAEPGMDFPASGQDEKHLKELAAKRNCRRFVGFLMLAAAAALTLPQVFEPNDYYADRGAKLEIPALTDGTPAKVVPLAADDPAKKAAAERPQPGIAPAQPPAAENLVQSNKVKAEAKPVHQAVVTDSRPAVTASQVTKNAPKPAAAPVAQASDTQVTPLPAPVEPLRASANGRYFIQVIATSNKSAAQKHAANLNALGLPAYTEIVHRRGSDLWRVRVGRFMSEDQARRAMDILALNSIDNGGIHQEKATKAPAD